jgi:hypothetical protein
MTLATALRLLPGVIILALVLAVIGLKSNRDLWKGRTQHLTQLREFERKSYDRAQEIAADLNKAEIERIRKQQEAITDEVSSDHARDLAELRRLRAKTPAPRSAPGGTQIPGVPEAPGGTDENGLPAAPCDDLCASEIELRLMHLQNWIAEQGK